MIYVVADIIVLAYQILVGVMEVFYLDETDWNQFVVYQSISRRLDLTLIIYQAHTNPMKFRKTCLFLLILRWN